MRNVALCVRSGSYILCSKDEGDNWEIEQVGPDLVDPGALDAIQIALKDYDRAKNPRDDNTKDEQDAVGDGDGVDSDDEDEEEREIGNEEMDVMIDKELQDDEEQLMAVQGITELIHQGVLLPDGGPNEDSAGETITQALEELVSKQPADTDVVDSTDQLMWGLDLGQEEGDTAPDSVAVSTVNHRHDPRSPSPTAPDHHDTPSSIPSVPPTPHFYVAVPILPDNVKALYHPLVPQTPPPLNDGDDEGGSLYEVSDGDDDDACLLGPTGKILPPQSPQKRKIHSTTTGSSPSSLLVTPFLQSINLAYHIQYQLLICTSCDTGISLDQCWQHVTGRSAVGTLEWDRVKEVYVESKIRHQSQLGPSMKRPQFLKKLRSQIADALQELGGGDEEDEDEYPTMLTSYHTSSQRKRSEEWLETVKPHLDQDGPVEGLKVFFHGLICNAPPCSHSRFPFCAVNLRGMQRHHVVEKGDDGVEESGIDVYHDVPRKRGEKLWVEGPIQSFFQARGLAAWFPVRGTVNPTANILPSSSTSPVDLDSAALANLIDQVEARYATTVDPGRNGRSELLDPALGRMGLVAVWEKVSNAEARRITLIRPVIWDSAAVPTRRLFAAVSATFLGTCNIARKTNSGLLNLIGKGAACVFGVLSFGNDSNDIYLSRLYTNPTVGRAFSIPARQTTLTTYLLWELQFLRHMLYAIRNPIRTESGEEAFRLDNRQQDALRALDTALRSASVPLAEVGRLVDDALYSLYFPACPERAAFDVFEDPVFIYISLICRTGQGNPMALANIPPMLSKVQFSVRLKALRYLHHDFQRRSATRPTTAVPSSGQTMRQEESLSTRQPSAPSPTTSQSHPPRTLRPRTAQVSNTLDASDSEAETEGSAVSYQESGSSESDSASERDRMDVDEEGVGRTVEAGGAAGNEGTAFEGWFERYVELMVFQSPNHADVLSGSFAVVWCHKHLTPGNISPYSTIRDLMHISSYHQRNSRKLPNMQWLEDDRLLVDKEHYFIPSEFFKFVVYRLMCLEIAIRDHVLRGFTLEDLGILCDFSKMDESGDIRTDLYCPLFPRDALKNEDSKRFMVKLLQQGTLVSPAGEGEVTWNAGVGWAWTGAIREATLALYALAHILQGSPGRTSEEHLMQIANTTTSRRHLFVENAIGTLAIFSNYWKGASVQGRFKEVLRVFPYRISRLLFILIRVVRPVERLFLMQFEAPEALAKAPTSPEASTEAPEGSTEAPPKAPKAQKKPITNTYRTMLWVAGGHQIKNRALLDAIIQFFKYPDADGVQRFKWIHGVRLYRHLVVALQRRLLPGTRQYTTAIEREGIQIGDLQAGRSGGVSEQNYAVLQTSIPADGNFISHYQAYSMRWHQLFGQSTGFVQDYQYIV
ncbi:hypothetical protein MD484_g6068, partial [Candolleomyces efflorescens]